MITTLTGLQRGRVHLEANLSIRCTYPNFSVGVLAHIAQWLDLFTRHTTDIDQTIEINETMCPWCKTGTLIIVTERITPGASQLDLRLSASKGEGVIICERYAQLMRALFDHRRDLGVE